MNHEANSKVIHESNVKEIDILALVKRLWINRKVLIKYIMIFICLGLFIAIFTPKEYTASTTIVPASQGKNSGGNLGGLAAMAGINLGSMSSESGISPSLYPQIISSITFQKELLETTLTFEGQKNPISYKDYYLNYSSPGLLGYIKKYTIGLPGLLLKAIKGKPKQNFNLSKVNETNIQSITVEEDILIKQLSKQLSLNINDKDGFVSLSVNMPEPMAAAEMAQRAQLLLQKYIINFKVQKSSEQLKFIKSRYDEKEKEFIEAAKKYAEFQDQNQSVNSAVANIKLKSLERDYDLVFGVFSELAKKMEAQQIQVKEDTPVFTVIKPVSVPIIRAKPNRPMILFVWTFLGLIIGIGVILGKLYLIEVKEKWNK